MATIQKVCVIGSGVMGSGIAAHLANAGMSVLLLDMKQDGFGKKNALAEEAIERLLKTDPAPLMHKSKADLITPGNIENDLEKIKEYDWVIEVIVEKLEVKQALYAEIEKHRGPQTLISSNTSTIPLQSLTEGRSDAFKKHFMITHFFNPPRYMRLLEMVKGKETDAQAFDRLKEFCDRTLGKGVVVCHDTPGFIANRIGTYWLQTALNAAIDQQITVEEADAILGKPMGIPKTGVFGLLDLVGLDLMPLIGKSMMKALPATDPYAKGFREHDILTKLIADGYTGRKGKGGFYRLRKEEDKKIKEALDLNTGQYRRSQKPTRLASLDVAKEGLHRFFNVEDKGSVYGWTVLSEVLCYAANLVPEIAPTVQDVDEAMRLGYNWKWGPFELLDKLGSAWVAEKLKSQGRAVPALIDKVGEGTFYKIENGQIYFYDLSGTYKPLVRPEGVLLLRDIKLRSKPLLKNASASLWDVGDGVVCFEFTTKQNSVDLDLMSILDQSIDLVEKDYKAMVIYNEGAHFSAGANLGLALFAANVGAWDLIAQLVAKGQQVYQRLKHSGFPVVAAPSGMALGGGCEVVLHSNAVQAHAETYIGLVEVGVGVVPAWGGCKEMLHRWLNEAKRPGGAMVAIGKVFETIGTAKVAKSADEAKDFMFLRPCDAITMNRDRLLADAKAKALSMVSGYQAPDHVSFSLPGSMARVGMNMAVKGLVKAGKATPYDEEVAKKLSVILSGGDTDITDQQSEEDILKLEREAFMDLIHDPRTLARMEHILEYGKPLRN
jgi:3-hydroxyacyl-CoA dehydrogenase